MNKFKVTRVPGKEDAYANYTYKTCWVCTAEVPLTVTKYWVDSNSWWGHRVCCSEECVNIMILQRMDDKLLTGYDYMSKSIQEGIDNQIIADLHAMAKKSLK